MKRITQKDLQEMYPALPDETNVRLEAFISALPERKEPVQVKKKLSVAVALAAALILVTMGAVAAAMNWDAVQYLFTGERDDLAPYRQDVNATAENEWVRASVNSVLYDGYILAFDLACENLDPSWPIFVQASNLPRLDGERSTDFSCLDIAGWCYDEQQVRYEGGGGQVIREKPFTITLKLMCMRPKQPTKVLINSTPEEETQWVTDGYRIIKPQWQRTDGTTFWRMIPEKYWDLYDIQHLDLSFEVVPPKNVNPQRMQPAQEMYETPAFTGYYRAIQYTPLGVYAEFVQIPTEEALRKETHFERYGNIDWNMEQTLRRMIPGKCSETTEDGQTVYVTQKVFVTTEKGVPEGLCLEWTPLNEVGWKLKPVYPLKLQ